MARSEVGSPHARSRSYQPDWAVTFGPPSTLPTPWTTMLSPRLAVTRGSFCRSDPAAVLRGLANGALPASTSAALSSSNRATGKNTSPRTSSTLGMSSPVSRSGTTSMVRRLGVTSSPVRPSPRVSAADQPAVLVEQVDGQPVDLELAQVGRDGAGVALDPLRPGRDLVGGERVVEAEHPLEVVDRREQGGVGAGDPLGGRGRRAQVGELVLELLQPAQVAVVLGVAAGGRVEDVVAVGVVVERLGQPRVLLARPRARLGHT